MPLSGFSAHWSGRVVRKEAGHLQKALCDRHSATSFGPVHFSVLYGRYYLSPILQTRKLRPAEIKEFSPGHTAFEWLSQESNLHWSASKA